MVRILNLRDYEEPERTAIKNNQREGIVYVGRPSKWGNPWSHVPNTLAKYKVATRIEAINAFKTWMANELARNPVLLKELRDDLGGKDLACWCAPQACHADILSELANFDIEHLKRSGLIGPGSAPSPAEVR